MTKQTELKPCPAEEKLKLAMGKMKSDEIPLHLIGHQPPYNQNFIAIYGDGSGASLYCWLDSGEIADAEGDIVFKADELQDALQDAGFCFWMPLPDRFEFFFMQGALGDVVSDWPEISKATHDFCKQALKKGE